MNTAFKEPYGIIILAAGKGKRMNNPDCPKVLINLKDKPLIQYVLDQTSALNSEKIVIVVGHYRQKVIGFVESLDIQGVQFAIQTEQLGTGHAVDQTNTLFSDYQGNILILSGDVPLLRTETLETFINLHYSSKSDISVLTADAPNPSGYGRIVRDEDGNFTKIVEDKDANTKEKQIKEFNSGIYFVNSKLLFESLKSVSNINSQGEYYLTDIIEILFKQNTSVYAFKVADYDELQGINSQEQLANIELLLKINRSIID